MKKVIIALILCIFTVTTAHSHPGKTDKYGGHQCIKGCEEWKLFYKEYHLHDKDGKPIRIAKTKKTRHVKPRSLQTETSPAVQTEPPITVQTATVYHYVTNVYEEKMFSINPLLWVILILLLLLLIVRRNKKKSAD